MIDNEAKELITGSLVYLYKYEPFYAYILAQMQINQSDEFPTLGVGYKNGTIELVYNPQFIKDNAEFTTAFLIHECGHVLHNHLSVEIPNKNIVKMQVMNIAMDSVINGYIDKLENMLVPAEYFVLGNKTISGKYVGPSKDLYDPTAEEVYKHLMDIMPKETKQAMNAMGSENEEGNKGDMYAKGIGKGVLDDHSKFGNTGKDESTIITKSIVQNAVNKVKGNVPNHLQQYVDAILKSQTNVNWVREMRKFSGSAVENGQYKTITKPNKKYGYPFFGRRTKYSGKIAVALDVSGSVSNKDLEHFLGEMHNISKQTGLQLLIAQGDTEVSDISTYKRKQLKKFIRTANGGTELQPMINAAAKRSRFVVVFTDGYANVPEKPKHTSLMFVLTYHHDRSFEKEANEIGKVAIMKNNKTRE